MGCKSSTMRHPGSQLDKGDDSTPGSTLLSPTVSDVPVMPLDSPSTGYQDMKSATPPNVQPAQHRLRRRQRQEPPLDYHLLDRIESLIRYLERATRIDNHGTMFVLAQRAIDDLRNNIEHFFIAYRSEKRTLWRLAQTGRLVQQVESFHRALDAITARCGLAVASPDGVSLPRWQPRWRRMRAERLLFFRSYLDHEAVSPVSKTRIREPKDQLEILSLLKYDAKKYDALLTADELKLSEQAFTYVAGSGTTSMHVDRHLKSMALPEWFVAPYERAKQQLQWQRAAVTVQKAPHTMNSLECFTLASTWSRLQHPHIMKLFGACHVGRKRFFVIADGTPLTRCLGEVGFPLWQALYEAASALRFLHDRRVGLDTLSCADIVLFRSADRDTAMLSGFNFRQMKSTMASSAFSNKTEEEDPLLEDIACDADYDEVDAIQDNQAQLRIHETDLRRITRRICRAPEISSGSGPTEESDIFLLGACVIEAFSGGNVWGSSTQADADCENANGGWQWTMPSRPKSMQNDWQWALVVRMCSPDPEERPSLAEVLASFQVFAEDEDKESTDRSSSNRRKRPYHRALVRTQPRATPASIACSLSEVQAWCDEATESSSLNYQLYERMADIAAGLEPLETDKIASDVQALGALILRFRDMLQRHVNENILLRLAATRQVIETNFMLHEELDALMDNLGLNRTGASIHSWTFQQKLYREQLWKRMRLTLAIDAQTITGELGSENELSLLAALLAFETNKRNTSYSVSDLELLDDTLVKVENACKTIIPGSTVGPNPADLSMISDPSVRLPPWFVPPYEVRFNELEDFNRGVFGSVHLGKWLGLDVVVKKMPTPEEHGATVPLHSRRGAKFSTNDPYEQALKEVAVWFTLDHPNVLKLFGACHVGSYQFCLYEYAGLGSVENYVASKPSNQRGVCARRLLHEAALGIHYLHMKNIVHTDLKCNNILVDKHGAAKVTDFGYCSFKKREQNTYGSNDAYRWIAPECLNGENPTFASNVYSFAMCAIEVVSGELPWGSEMTDAAVRSKVRRGMLPPRPANCFSDSEWDVIERMCCHNISERITISRVVELLACML